VVNKSLGYKNINNIWN